MEYQDIVLVTHNFYLGSDVWTKCYLLTTESKFKPCKAFEDMLSDMHLQRHSPLATSQDASNIKTFQMSDFK